MVATGGGGAVFRTSAATIAKAVIAACVRGSHRATSAHIGLTALHIATGTLAAGNATALANAITGVVAAEALCAIAALAFGASGTLTAVGFLSTRVVVHANLAGHALIAVYARLVASGSFHVAFVATALACRTRRAIAPTIAGGPCFGSAVATRSRRANLSRGVQTALARSVARSVAVAG